MKFYKTLSLGCKVNSYEIQSVKELLNKNGYQEVLDENGSCDVFIINTCAVTQVGEQKSRQKIRWAIKKYPDACIVVMGCYSQLHPEIVETIEGVDVIIGTKDRNKILEFIERHEKGREKLVEVEKDTRHRTYECLEISDYTENTRAFLKIQDGCNNFCSYCIIPYTRGNFRSRPKEEILSEVKRLVSNGFQEIVLTGIDTSGYGKDFGKRCFDDLLEEILKTSPELKRLRISSIEESQLSDKFIDLLKNSNVIAHHLHMPLQSGSATVLKRMRRLYTKEMFKNTIDRIKEAVPDIALACDVIVGFPGESEEEFEETCQFIKECGFAYLHVFPYSKRPGTPASTMENQVDEKIKKDRTRRLINLGEKLKEEYENKFLGKEVDVLIETYDEKRNIYKGYSSNYLEVCVKSDINIIGKYIKTIYTKEN